MRKVIYGLILLIYTVLLTNFAIAQVPASQVPTPKNPVKIYESDDGFEVYTTGYEVHDEKFYQYFLLKNNTKRERTVCIYPGFYLYDNLGNVLKEHLVYIRNGENTDKIVKWDAIAPGSWIKAGIVIKGFDPKCYQFRIRYSFGFGGEYSFYKDFINHKGEKPAEKPADGVLKDGPGPSSEYTQGKLILKRGGIKVYALAYDTKEKQFSQDFSIKNTGNTAQTVAIGANSYINDNLGNKFDSDYAYFGEKDIKKIITIPPGGEVKAKVIIKDFDNSCETFKVRYSFSLGLQYSNYQVRFLDYVNRTRTPSPSEEEPVDEETEDSEAGTEGTEDSEEDTDEEEGEETI